MIEGYHLLIYFFTKLRSPPPPTSLPLTKNSLSFSLQLWEEDGLDLALIPYGCIATGPDTGFIEVVRNAKTIAEVSETLELEREGGGGKYHYACPSIRTTAHVMLTPDLRN